MFDLGDNYWIGASVCCIWRTTGTSFFFSVCRRSPLNRSGHARWTKLTDAYSAALGSGEGNRIDRKEANALLARVEQLETFLSLKFPSWRDEVAALAPTSSSKDNKGAGGTCGTFFLFLLTGATPSADVGACGQHQECDAVQRRPDADENGRRTHGLGLQRSWDDWMDHRRARVQHPARVRVRDDGGRGPGANQSRWAQLEHLRFLFGNPFRSSLWTG